MKTAIAGLLLTIASFAATTAQGAPYAWVLASGDTFPSGEIIAIDLETDQVAVRIPGASAFLHVEASPGRRYAYAISDGRSLLIDTSALAPVASLGGFRQFHLHPTREEAYTRPPSD